jgi:CRP/FNR family transcriptional regulator, nitrogen oxide reductase regulator
VASILCLPATQTPPLERQPQDISGIRLDGAKQEVSNRSLEGAACHDQLAAPTARMLDDVALDARVACLTTAWLFHGLSRSECCEIASSAQELRYSPRQVIFQQDDAVRYVYVISTGTVKVTQLTECGNETLLRVERNGGLIDDLTETSQVHVLTASAIDVCCLLAWNASVFGEFARRFAVIQRNATAILLDRLRTLQERFCDVTTRRVSERLARLIIHLAALTTEGELAPIALSRQEIAQMTGTSLFTVSRLLSSWAESDILTVDRKIVVIEDLRRLRKIAKAA